MQMMENIIIMKKWMKVLGDIQCYWNGRMSIMCMFNVFELMFMFNVLELGIFNVLEVEE